MVFNIISRTRSALRAYQKNQEIVFPLSQNGKEKIFYLGVRLQEVKPLGSNGDVYFRGQTCPSNGQVPEYVDGFTSEPPNIPSKKGECRCYGKLLMY
ncbi:hypothetical protein K9K85_02475 [Patescibacteria group bacterium]|nr:hypothetical protein [Patescibacteria group bacterium]